MKVGLVLGAGGVTGGAWLTGALYALVEETGWDPGSADVVVGTSAGSGIGTIVAAGGGPPGGPAPPPARSRRRRRRLVRDPRLLPPGPYRPPPLRRRRRVLGLQPRRPGRRGPGPRDLPEPVVLAYPQRRPDGRDARGQRSAP